MPNFKTNLAYSLPAFALAVIGIPVYVYIPKFYTDVVGIDIATAGFLLFGVRIFDSVTDPIVGLWSDRSRSRFGRRTPFMVVGSLLLAVALILLFNPPNVSRAMGTIWFGLWIYLLFFFWTLVAVPYEALGPEITYDYDARTNLFAWRDGFLIAGTLMAAASPTLVRTVFETGTGPDGERMQFFWISMLYGPLVIIFCWISAKVVRENINAVRHASKISWREYRTIFRNRPFLVLLSSYTISAIGSNLPATMILYYVEYVLISDLADLFLLIYFVTGILFLPLWVGLSHRFGKKQTWIGAMLVNTCAFTGVYFLGPGDELIYGVLVVLSGMGFGATLALPSAIQADVIDYDELKTGERREGQYIGLWSVSKKLAAAVGVGVGLVVLGAVGYVPKAAQSETVILTLRILYALVPSACNLIALVIALAYPIDGRIHRCIRETINRRNERGTIADPLTTTQSCGL